MEQRKLDNIDNKHEVVKRGEVVYCSCPSIGCFVSYLCHAYNLRKALRWLSRISVANTETPRATQEEDLEPNPMEMVEPTNTNENYAHTELVTPSSAAQGDPMVHAKPPACLKPAHPLIPVK